MCVCVCVCVCVWFLSLNFSLARSLAVSGIPINRVEDAVLRGYKESKCALGKKSLATPGVDHYVGSYVWKVLAAEGSGFRVQGLGLEGACCLALS